MTNKRPSSKTLETTLCHSYKLLRKRSKDKNKYNVVISISIIIISYLMHICHLFHTQKGLKRMWIYYIWCTYCLQKITSHFLLITLIHIAKLCIIRVNSTNYVFTNISQSAFMFGRKVFIWFMLNYHPLTYQ